MNGFQPVPNVRQRQVMARLATAPTAEQRAAQARDFERRYRRPLDASTRFELERADRIAAQLEADALLRRVRAAGEVGCADPEPIPSLLARLLLSARDGLRQEFGNVWPAWAVLYGLFVTGGLAGFVLVIKAWTGAQP